MIPRLRRFFDIRPGESLPLLLTFFYIAVVIASFLLAKPIRSGLFLNKFGAYKLVYVYVGVPLALSIFVPIYTRIAAHVGQQIAIVGSLIFFSLNVVAFWYLFRFHPFSILPAAFYIWVNCYAIIAPVQAWTFANTVFDTRQAKRLFGLIGSGASLGAITGGLMASRLVKPVGGTVNLLLVLAGLIALGAAIVSVAWRIVPARRSPQGEGGPRRVIRATDRRARAPFRRTLRLVRDTPYLRWIAALVVLVAIVTQWTQFQFALAAEQRFAGDPDRLTQFYGNFSFYLGMVAFTVQLLLTGAALRTFGIGFTILLLPISLGLGSMSILLVPVLATVLITNAFDQGLRFSIDKATFELLYLPLPAGVKEQVKPTIDVAVNRFADAIGGILLALATQGFSLVLFKLPGAGFGLRGTAAVNLVLIGLWIIVALALRRGYVEAIGDSIRQHRLKAERASATVFDRSTTELLARTLREGKPADVLYALSLFEAQYRNATHPALQELLHHPAAEVRSKALAILRAAGDRSVVPRVEEMLHDRDLDTRTEALLYLAYVMHEDPLARVRKLGDFPDFSIRAGIVACLARPGRMQNLDAARLVIDRMLDEHGAGGQRARLEAARLIAALPQELAGEFDGHLQRLLDDPDPDVLRQAIRAVGRFRQPAPAARVLARLGDPALQSDAAETLARLGDPIVPLLRAHLFDAATPGDLRREIPAVLMRIGTPAAEQALVESLLHTDPMLRLRIVASLNKLRQTHPEIPLDLRVVETLLGAEILGHYRSYQILGTLAEALHNDDDPVVQALKQSMEQELERIFRLLGLVYQEQDLHSAYFGLRSTNPSVRANALEFLDNILKPQLRSLLVPLLDSHVAIEERVALANRVVGTAVESEEQAVAALGASDDPWLRSCAAYLIGTLRVEALQSDLDRWMDDPDPLLRETARSAKARLLRDTTAPSEEAEAASTAWPAQESIGIG